MNLRGMLFSCLATVLAPQRPLGAKILYRLDPVRFLRQQGAQIGEDCRILTGYICSEPYLLRIGRHVSLGMGVQLITHDGAVWVLRHLENNPHLDRFAPITIGDNVFIGNDAKILPGVTIGNNVIIGATSVVTKHIPANTVYGGVPARFLGTTEGYRARHLPSCLETKTRSPAEKRRVLQHSFAP